MLVRRSRFGIKSNARCMQKMNERPLEFICHLRLLEFKFAAAGPTEFVPRPECSRYKSRSSFVAIKMALLVNFDRPFSNIELPAMPMLHHSPKPGERTGGEFLLLTNNIFRHSTFADRTSVNERRESVQNIAPSSLQGTSHKGRLQQGGIRVPWGLAQKQTL